MNSMQQYQLEQYHDFACTQIQRLGSFEEIHIRDFPKRNKSILISGGRIDHAHHFNNAYLALSETVALDDAVRVAMEMTGDDTLLVVTADHSWIP